MKTYHVTGKTPMGDMDLEISRSEIVSMKNEIMDNDKAGYSEMLRIMSHPAAIIRYQMIPGTRRLRWILNACILLGRLGIVVVIVFLIMRYWWWALGTAVLDYFLVSYVQTWINYEIGARLFVLDQRLYQLEQKSDYE